MSYDVVVVVEMRSTMLESRILVYLSVAPMHAKTTSKIFEKVSETCRSYSYLCTILRTLEARGILKSQKIQGGKAKAWEIKPEIKDKIFEAAKKRLGKLLAEEQELLESDGILQENPENCKKNEAKLQKNG